MEQDDLRVDDWRAVKMWGRFPPRGGGKALHMVDKALKTVQQGRLEGCGCVVQGCVVLRPQPEPGVTLSDPVVDGP